MPVPRLLELASQALASALLHNETSAQYLARLASIPEPELAQGVWQLYQQALPGTAVPWTHHHAVALAFAQAFWQPGSLELRNLPDEAHALRCLPALSSRLRHLALALLAAHSTTALSSLATCPQLRCLCLRGCNSLSDGSFEALVGCTTLRALDVSGLAQVTDAAAVHWSRLPVLSILNASHTLVGDKALELLSYGHRLRAWAQQRPTPPPPELMASWPALPLSQLRLAATRVTSAGLGWLRDLPSLALLDVRWTGLPRGLLVPLQQRFGLQLVQGAVVSSSNAMVVAVVNYDSVACACPLPQGPTPRTEQWAVQGALLLLYACPSRGATAFLSQESQLGHDAESDEAPSLLRRRGYRYPAGRPKRGRQAVGAEGRGVPAQASSQAMHNASTAVGSSPPPRRPWQQSWPPPPQGPAPCYYWAPPQQQQHSWEQSQHRWQRHPQAQYSPPAPGPYVPQPPWAQSSQR